MLFKISFSIFSFGISLFASSASYATETTEEGFFFESDKSIVVSDELITEKKRPTSYGALLGTWKNTNPNTRGITKVIFYKSGSNLRIRVFGSCSPSDCDWGVAYATPFSRSVSSSAAYGFTANYNKSHAYTQVEGTRRGSYLYLNYYTKFKDGSNRYDYFGSGTFRK